MITESIPKNLIDFSQKIPIPDDLSKVLEAVYITLCEWSSNTNLKERIKVNISSVLASKKIKICTSPLNTYKTICKILYEAKESMVSLSQMLFCQRETSLAEIISFCKRCLLDPFKRIYVIIGIDRLEYSMSMELKNSLLSIIEFTKENLNFNLLIFNNSQAKTVSSMFDSDHFENINHSLEQLDQMVKDSDY